MIQQSADALLRLLNDILDFSKIEAGKLELERSVDFSLRDCVGKRARLSGAAAEKGLELACRIRSGVARNAGWRPRDGFGKSSSIWREMPSSSPNKARSVIDVTEESDHGRMKSLALFGQGHGHRHPPEKRRKSSIRFDKRMLPRPGNSVERALDWRSRPSWSSMMNGQIWVESEPGHGRLFASPPLSISPVRPQPPCPRMSMPL